jgi:hypothetical protein
VGFNQLGSQWTRVCKVTIIMIITVVVIAIIITSYILQKINEARTLTTQKAYISCLALIKTPENEINVAELQNRVL